jgi:serine/threonine-protein kinase
MAPEVVQGAAVTRQADVFSAGIVLWEALAGKMLFGGANEHERLTRIVAGNYPSPRQYNPRVSQALETVVAKALAVDPHARYATALEFAVEIERVVPIASRRLVGEWVRRLAASTLDEREAMIHAIETSSIVALSELSASPSRMAGTPPPIPSAKIHTPAPAESPLPVARIAPPPEPSADEESGSYAAIEIQQTHDPMSAHATMARRRPAARVLAVAAAVALAAMIPVFAISRHAKVRGTVPDLASSSTQMRGARTKPPGPVPPVVQPWPGSDESLPSAQSEKPTKDVAPPRRALPSSPLRAGGTSHAKHYLPSKL